MGGRLTGITAVLDLFPKGNKSKKKQTTNGACLDLKVLTQQRKPLAKQDNKGQSAAWGRDLPVI